MCWLCACLCAGYVRGHFCVSWAASFGWKGGWIRLGWRQTKYKFRLDYASYVRGYVPVMCVAISAFFGLCHLVGKADGFGSGAVSPNLGSCAVCACSRGSKRLAQQCKIIAIRANLFISTAIECAWLGAWLCARLCARLCAWLCAWLCARLCAAETSNLETNDLETSNG